jgi:predicted small secreted protein
MKLSALTALVVLIAAVLLTGCGGGSSSTMHGPRNEESGGPAAEPGAAKKATAPNAPAGSRVISCDEGAEEMVGLRATMVDCGTARTVMRQWGSSHACTLGKSGSRSSCSLGGFRCQAVKVDRGAAVSCARPGGDVSFIAKAWLLRRAGSG